MKIVISLVFLTATLFFAQKNQINFEDLADFAGEIPDDWQIYRNEQYGFELRKPADWREIGTIADVDHYYLAFQGPELAGATAKPYERQNLSVILQIYEPPLADNIEGRNCKNGYDGKDKSNCLDRYVQFNGIEAVKKTYKVPEIPAILARDYDFIKDGRMFHFYTSAYSGGETLEELAATRLYIDKMVSSFRFLEK